MSQYTQQFAKGSTSLRRSRFQHYEAPVNPWIPLYNPAVAQSYSACGHHHYSNELSTKTSHEMLGLGSPFRVSDMHRTHPRSRYRPRHRGHDYPNAFARTVQSAKRLENIMTDDMHPSAMDSFSINVPPPSADYASGVLRAEYTLSVLWDPRVEAVPPPSADYASSVLWDPRVEAVPPPSASGVLRDPRVEAIRLGL